jgi:two-component system OmpR family sensor kinase
MADRRPLSASGLGQRRLLATLERLLEIPTSDLRVALSQAAQVVAETLGADKVDVYLHDRAADALVALGTSDTPMARLQRARHFDRLPMANGGRTAGVFLTGCSYCTGDAGGDPGELRRLVRELGIRSEIATPLEVDGRRRGVLLIVSARPDFFDQADVRFVEAVARWVGLVILRAELAQQPGGEAARREQGAAAEELMLVLAHDLRNRLTPLKTRLGLIEMRANREGRTRDATDAASAAVAADRVASLLTDLLDVSRMEQGIFAISPQTVELAALARETAEAFVNGATEVRVQAAREVLAYADPGRVRRALETLLVNAIRHAPTGSPVLVGVHTETGADGQRGVITVSDQGPRVPADILPTLVSRFAAGRGSKGLGLGLYIASRIAAAHGGTLTVDPTLESGACFALSLPLAGTPDEVA